MQAANNLKVQSLRVCRWVYSEDELKDAAEFQETKIEWYHDAEGMLRNKKTVTPFPDKIKAVMVVLSTRQSRLLELAKKLCFQPVRGFTSVPNYYHIVEGTKLTVFLKHRD